MIAQNIHGSGDVDGYSENLIVEILDFATDSSVVEKEDNTWTFSSEGKLPRKTTEGWRFLSQIRGGTQVWYSLKENGPVLLAEFATDMDIADGPALSWWVFTMRKRDVISSSIKSRLKVETYTYGVQVHTMYSHAKKLIEVMVMTCEWRLVS